MKNKLLILGSSGMIGHQVFNYLNLSAKFEMHDISYRKKLREETILLDIRNEENFINTVKEIKPDFIINCIGILIEGANKDPENAIFINAYMPHRIKRLADELGSKLIHISTDCVFSGRKKEAYIESDEKDGLDTYAKAKGLGEIICDDHLTLRTSVIGPELKTDGEELFHWFMKQEGKINGFTKSIWSGVTTLELSKAVQWAIEENIVGLYHVTNNQSINKFDLLNLIKKYMKKNIVINKVDGKDVDKSFIDTRKERKYKIPSYEVMISEMIENMNKSKTLYYQYFNKKCIMREYNAIKNQDKLF